MSECSGLVFFALGEGGAFDSCLEVRWALGPDRYVSFWLSEMYYDVGY